MAPLVLSGTHCNSYCAHASKTATLPRPEWRRLRTVQARRNFNATEAQATFTDSRLQGSEIASAPVQRRFSDQPLGESTFNSKQGTAVALALTTAVFVVEADWGHWPGTGGKQ